MSTVIGGCATVILVILLLIFGIGQLKIMYNMEKTNFQVSERFINLDSFRNNSMGRHYSDSFNFLIGTSNETIDWYDNSYFKLNVYELDERWIPVISPTVTLVKCTD